MKVQNETNSSALTLSESLPENFSELNRKEFKNNLLASADNSILPVVKTSSENNETSLKQDHVTASSISEKSRMETERITNSQEKPVKIQPLAIAGLIAGIVGLFIAGIPLGIIAVIFGIIALNKIKKNPDIFRGKGLSIASVILGFIAIIGAIIVLSM